MRRLDRLHVSVARAAVALIVLLSIEPAAGQAFPGAYIAAARVDG